jgi:hypothetical protein
MGCEVAKGVRNEETRVQRDEKRCTDKKTKIFLIYREVKIGSVAKSYMRKGFLKYEEMLKYLTIYEETASHILYDFATDPF